MRHRNRPAVDASVRRYALVWAGVNVFERESVCERERESERGTKPSLFQNLSTNFSHSQRLKAFRKED